MLLGRVPLLHQLHAAIPSNPVREMHDDIPFIQLQKTINRPRLNFPSPLRFSRDRRPPEQLMIAEHNDPLSDQPKAAIHAADAEHDAIG